MLVGGPAAQLQHNSAVDNNGPDNFKAAGLTTTDDVCEKEAEMTRRRLVIQWNK